MANGSVTTRPKSRDPEQDAYFDDEWASGNAPLKGGVAMNPATGCHFNKFDVTIAAGRTAAKSFANPLQNATVALLAEPGTQATNNYRIFIPTGLAGVGPDPNEVIPVTLYAGPGLEFCRHGLRTFFDKTTKQVLIGMPGTEPTTFGFGLTKDQIDQLFTAAGLSGVKWQITVLVPFSTGYRGIIGVINNTKPLIAKPPQGTVTSNPGLGLDLSGVKKLVFIDCLYRTDAPKPARTDEALQSLNAVTGGAAETIVYEVTDGGTPRDSGKLRANFPAGMKTTIINLKSQFTALRALIFARRIDNGIKDGFTTRAEVQSLGGQPLLDLIDKHLPKTRTIASTAATGSVHVGNWAPSSLTNLLTDSLTETLRDKVINGALIANTNPKRFTNELMGWGPPNTAEMQHDGFMSEIGWEHMAG